MSAERISTSTMPNPAEVRRMQEAYGQPSAEAELPAQETIIDVAEMPSSEPITVKVTTRQRGGVSRPQGAPENSTATGELSVGEEKNVELSDSAQPIISTRDKKGATRAQGPSKEAALANELAKEERRLRVVLGSRAVERAGDDFVRNEAIRKLSHRGHDVSGLLPKQEETKSEETTSKPKHRKESDSPIFEQLAQQFTDNGREFSLEAPSESARPKHRKGDTEEAIVETSDQVPEGFPANIWENLSDEERQRAAEAWGKMSEADRAKAFNRRIIPVEKPQPGRHKKERVTTRDRIKGAFAGNRSESHKPADDKEKTKKRRIRRAIGALALVVAGAGIAAEVANDMSESHSGNVTTHAKPQHVEKGKVIASKYHKQALRAGETYWGDTERAHPHASEAEIHELVAKELKKDGRSWEDARHLPVGTRVSIR